MSAQETIRAIMSVIHKRCLRQHARKFTGDLTIRLTWNEGSPYPRIKIGEETTEEVEE